MASNEPLDEATLQNLINQMVNSIPENTILAAYNINNAILYNTIMYNIPNNGMFEFSFDEMNAIVDEEPQQTVVRDPVGEINLRAFAQDQENVQREPLQKATQVTLASIVDRPLPQDQYTLQEIQVAFLQHYGADAEEALFEIDVDLRYDTQAFGYSYATVLDHIWALIRDHEHKEELIKRLYEEIVSGIGACPNGKMCHIMNVAQGYDDSITMFVSKDAFQSKMASLTKLPKEERLEKAKQAFQEYHIPEEEQEAWLEPLLSDDV